MAKKKTGEKGKVKWERPELAPRVEVLREVAVLLGRLQRVLDTEAFTLHVLSRTPRSTPLSQPKRSRK